MKKYLKVIILVIWVVMAILSVKCFASETELETGNILVYRDYEFIEKEELSLEQLAELGDNHISIANRINKAVNIFQRLVIIIPSIILGIGIIKKLKNKSGQKYIVIGTILLFIGAFISGVLEIVFPIHPSI